MRFAFRKITLSSAHTPDLSVAQMAAPAYLYHSPVGFHVRHVSTFLSSNSPAPISRDPEKAGWASQPLPSNLQQLRQHLTQVPSGFDTFSLLVYNKSRDMDRVCPSCRRWYSVSEPECNYGSYEEFTSRSYGDNGVVSKAQREERDLSGICCKACMDIMVEDQEQRIRKAGNVEREVEGWVMRRATVEEQEQSGVQFVWEKRTTAVVGQA